MVYARQPTFPPWVHPSGPRSPSFVRCGLQGGQRTRRYGSVPPRGSRQTSQHAHRALWLRCFTRQRNASLCTQTAEPGVATIWIRNATAVRYAGMQVRSKLDSGQARKRRGTGRSRGTFFFLRVSRICPCSRPWSTRRVREAEEQSAVFFGRASPTGPHKRKPDAAPFPSGRRQPNQKSIRLVHCDMFLSSCRNAVNGRACLCSPCKGPGISMRCRISGAGKNIAR